MRRALRGAIQSFKRELCPADSRPRQAYIPPMRPNPTKSTGNPGIRIKDQNGHSPRHGEVSGYARAVGLARIVIRGRLRRGELHVGADGLIYPRPMTSAHQDGDTP